MKELIQHGCPLDVARVVAEAEVAQLTPEQIAAKLREGCENRLARAMPRSDPQELANVIECAEHVGICEDMIPVARLRMQELREKEELYNKYKEK